MQEITQEITIQNKLGLHARASGKLVDVASRYGAEIMLYKGNEEANAKSIMGLMMLAAGFGTKINLHATGEDAAEAIQAVVELINNKFDEED